MKMRGGVDGGCDRVIRETRRVRVPGMINGRVRVRPTIQSE